jgi:hypothetical protein
MIKHLTHAALVLAFAAVAFAQPVVDAVIGVDEYANTLVHAESGAVVHWTIADDTLHMAFTMTAGGWAGIGWLAEQTNRKSGADMLIVTIQDGAPVILDMFQVSARGEPAADEASGGTNSVTEFAASHEGGVWTVEFVRPLATGEDADVDVVPGEAMTLLIAFSNVMDPSRAHARSTSGGAFYAPITF